MNDSDKALYISKLSPQQRSIEVTLLLQPVYKKDYRMPEVSITVSVSKDNRGRAQREEEEGDEGAKRKKSKISPVFP